MAELKTMLSLSIQNKFWHPYKELYPLTKSNSNVIFGGFELFDFDLFSGKTLEVKYCFTNG